MTKKEVIILDDPAAPPLDEAKRKTVFDWLEKRREAAALPAGGGFPAVAGTPKRAAGEPGPFDGIAFDAGDSDEVAREMELHQSRRVRCLCCGTGDRVAVVRLRDLRVYAVCDACSTGCSFCIELLDGAKVMKSRPPEVPP